MNTLGSSPSPRPTPPIALSTLATVLSEPTRWKILSLFAEEQPLMVKEVAQSLGKPRAAVSKHMALLTWANIVRIGSGGLYHLTEPFRIAPGQREIDFGHCVIRLGTSPG